MALSAFTYNASSISQHTIDLTFDVSTALTNDDMSLFTLQNSMTTPAFTINLAGATVMGGPLTWTVTLTTGQTREIQAQTTAIVSAATTYIDTTYDTPVTLQAASYTPDTTDPQLTSFSYYPSQGVLRIAANKPIISSSFAPTGLTLSNALTGGNSVALTSIGGSIVGSNATYLYWQLPPENAAAVAAAGIGTQTSNTFLSAVAGTFTDWAANDNSATAARIQATSVGDPSGYNISSSLQVSNNFTVVNGESDLGAISDVKISGGSANQIIQTDGAGNLTFVTPANAQIDRIGTEANPNTVVAENDGAIISSATTFITDFNDTPSGVANGGGRWIAIVPNQDYIYTSTDGTSWTQSGSVLPSSSNWAWIVYSGGFFVIGASGSTAAAYSQTGTTWTSFLLDVAHTNPFATNWVGSNNETIVVGNPTTRDVTYIATFPNYFWIAETFTPIPAGKTIGCLAASPVVFNNNSFSRLVALDNNGDAAYYTNGSLNTWQTATLPQSLNWVGVAWGNNRFFAVSQGLTTPFNSSVGAISFDGIAWTETELPSGIGWNRVVVSGNVFSVIKNAAFTNDLFTIDGETFFFGQSVNQHTTVGAGAPDAQGRANFVKISALSPAASIYEVVTQGAQASVNGLLNVTGDSSFAGEVNLGNVSNVKIAGGTADQFLQTDGAGNLTFATAPGGGAVDALGTQTTPNIVRVEDDFFQTSSTQRAIPASTTISGSAFGGGVYVALPSSGTATLRSTDGVNWTAGGALPYDGNWAYVAYGNGVFVAAPSGNTNTNIATSTDGNNWTALVPYQYWPGNATGITYGPNGFLLTSSNRSGFVTSAISSANGISWGLVFGPDYNGEGGASATAFGGGYYVVFVNSTFTFSGPQSRIYYGTTAAGTTNYLAYTSGETFATANKIVYGAGRFLAFSFSSTTAFTATDPTAKANWTVTLTPVAFRDIAVINDIFVGYPAASGNQYYTSTDGLTWTASNFFDSTNRIWSAASAGPNFVLGFSDTATVGATIEPRVNQTTVTGILSAQDVTLSGNTTGFLNLVPGPTSASLKFANAKEVVSVAAVGATGTIDYDITTQSILYYTTEAAANWTVNFRGSSSTTMNALMAVGESMTATFMVTQGATAFYNNVVQIDGVAVTPVWQGGSAPTAGTANSINTYTYAIVKTGDAAYTVFASLVIYA